MKKRYKHNLGHYALTTGDLGTILPISQYDVLPGDTIQHQSNVLIRLSTLVVPVMHPVQVGIYSFFTPYRILDDNFEDMITGAGATPPPTITCNNAAYNLIEAMGLNPNSGEDINAYHIYAYNKIYNEFFMDKDIQTEASLANKYLKNACWNKDFHTTIRATAQQGTAVSLPIGDRAEVTTDLTNAQSLSVHAPNIGASNYMMATDGTSGGNLYVSSNTTANDTLYADLANATGSSTISDFMEALAMQSYAEARNRYGETYVDYLRYLGVNPKDSRLQRPEYLGGGRSMIQFSEVLNQSATTGDLGDMGGHGIAAAGTPAFRRYIPEHGVVSTMMVIRPLHMLGNGLPHKYLKTAKEDYYQHELRNIGDRAILNKEIYDSHTTPDGTFGYGPRYDEYRTEPNIVCNEMRDAVYDDYHFARLFTSDPALNDAYIKCSPSNRAFADAGTNSNFLAMCNHNVVARRMVPKTTRPLGGLL